ncbi:MAG: MATE family efflux transporter [Clostridia bacterium]
MAKRVNLLEGNIAVSLTKLSLPIMGMSFLQMAYNLTDMFWIGKLGSGAVASVGTGGILVWLSMGIHTIAQLGGQVNVAQNLGAEKHKEAGGFAHAAIYISALCSLILGLVFTIGINPVVSFFALNSQEVIDDAKTYIIVCCGLIFFQLMAKLLTALITTTGDSKTPFFATTVGLVFNIILDPLLIFGFWIIPPLGVLGAAIATVLAQIIVFVILLRSCIKDTHLFIYVNILKLPEMDKLKKILKLGLPTTLQASLFPLISMYISRMVAGFGDDAVAVQRIGSQIESLSWMTTDGFAVAVNSFIAQNFGAKNLERIKKGFFQALSILSVYGLFVTAFLILCAEMLFSIFLQDQQVLLLGIDYLVILGISQLSLCHEILSSSAMNALGITKLPAVISISMTAIRIPLAIFLSATALGLNGIWWAVSISTIIKGAFLLIAVILIINKTTKKRAL